MGIEKEKSGERTDGRCKAKLKLATGEREQNVVLLQKEICFQSTSNRLEDCG